MLKNPQAMQKILKLMSHPETKELFSDPSFMSTLQLIMQNPSIATTLAQTDPRFKKVFDVLNAPDDPNQPDFASMFSGAAGASKPSKHSKMEEEEEPIKKEHPKETKKSEKSKETESANPA